MFSEYTTYNRTHISTAVHNNGLATKYHTVNVNGKHTFNVVRNNRRRYFVIALGGEVLDTVYWNNFELTWENTLGRKFRSLPEFIGWLIEDAPALDTDKAPQRFAAAQADDWARHIAERQG